MTAELRDQAARERITQALDRNLMVLAGAGAGKTHALIERMVRCVRAGVAPVERIAAITFTRKAAGEMRGRFFLRLRQEAGQTLGIEAERLREALDRVDQCFIGTIHSFCGQLLRERPVEARLPPDFSEIDDREEAVLRRQVWDDFVQGRFREEDGRLRQLDRLGLRTEDLYAFFVRRCLFSDLPLKETRVERPDLEGAMRRALDFIDEVEAQIPKPLPGKRDGCMETIQGARNHLENRPPETDGERVAFLKRLAASKARKVTLKSWDPNQAFAKGLRDEGVAEFQEGVLAPILDRWYEYVYLNLVDFIDEAVAYYEARRQQGGTLTFQDLLVKAGDLLRRDMGVRLYFQQRYRCLFVDEFQDTDPIQAEIVFYLSGTDPEERDWRRLVPRPGSLFLVGDEKQSIYRFRRADVETFRLVRDRIAASGGEVLQLNTSFRSLGRLCQWANGSFEPLFARGEAGYQADFSPLFQFRPAGADAHCVRRLVVDKVPRHQRAAIVATEAGRIAECIAAALAGQTEFNRGGPGGEGLLAPEASAGDFMILTRSNRYLSTYARALEARAIPYDIVGGSRLGDAPEVQALVEMLEVLYAPDDPLPFLGHLRGALVGLGDDELYDFSRAGGVFNYLEPLPEGMSPELEAQLQSAVGGLKRAAAWLEEEPPAVACEKILEDLGTIPFAFKGEMGSSRAGNMLRLLALVRQWEAQGMPWGEIALELRQLIDDPDYDIEEMTLEAGHEGVVRLMNLHQAKGLQAKVVFLADPYDTSAEGREADFHVVRTADKPYLSMPVQRPRGDFANETIAQPQGWDEDREEENRFLQGENLRLLYVAATRAEDLLVVSVYPDKPGRGPWAPLEPYLAGIPELPAYEAPPAAAAPELALDWEAKRQERQARLRQVRRPTYALDTVSRDDWSADMLFASGRWGRDFGNLTHHLFEQAVCGRLPDDEGAYIEELLRRSEIEGLSAETVRRVLESFRGSEIWAEVQRAGEVHSETPFAASLERGGRKEVVRGVIDLIYRIDGGWKVVDYKTDAVDGPAAVDGVLRRAKGQVDAYARYWEDISGEKVVEKGVWLTDIAAWKSV